MFRKMSLILIVFVSAACQFAGAKVDLVKIEPDNETLCSKYRGAQWAQCMQSAVEEWEKIHNAQGVKTVKSEVREGDWLYRDGNFCWHTFCKPYREELYDPSPLKRTLTHPVAIGIYVTAAVYVGATVSPAIFYLLFL